MIYLDTSVLLAQLLAEDRRSPASLWAEPLIASRLLEYETSLRLNAAGCAASHGDAARKLLVRTSLIELSPLVLQRALEPSRDRCVRSTRCIWPPCIFSPNSACVRASPAMTSVW